MSLFVLLQLDALHLILDAGPVVKAVMALLLAMSIGSWFVMGSKFMRLSKAGSSSSTFLQLFWEGDQSTPWSAERLEQIYSKAAPLGQSPIARVFHAGYVELARVFGADQAQGKKGQVSGDIDNVERALRRASVNELTQLESMLPFLATTGSVAPFIGLFGTVWGIMGSFLGLKGGAAGAKTTLDMVAPGIAEALIATAIGLLAAIPAVMAYNYFVRRVQVLESEMQTFSSDYLNIVRRHFLSGK